MINSRLFHLGQKKAVYKIVFYQMIMLVLNILMIVRMAYQIHEFYQNQFEFRQLVITIVVIVVVLLTRGRLKKENSKLAHQAGGNIKGKLRALVYEKLLALGGTYTKIFNTAEVLQISTEGIDQLETYYGNYLPQFFYAMIAPIVLFLCIAPIDIKVAIVLFICVPLIPISIIVIQKIAKKILNKYWGLYAQLGDNFLENVQGMTTLKIYGAEEEYHKQMNHSAEHFRIVTMKVLSMQLNSIIVMDVVAYGGTALGGILAVQGLYEDQINVMQAIIIILLASEFFIPMRTLGSYFHIAMNGMTAASKIFNILDLDIPEDGKVNVDESNMQIKAENLSFSYGRDKQILSNISFHLTYGVTAIVGVSGSGKSTIASILAKKELAYEGSIKMGELELREILKSSLLKELTYVSHQGYIFAGTIAENLKMVKEHATDQEMTEVLKKVRIWDFIAIQQGLATELSERGSNLSGGQRQRLNLARALLKNSAIYIFDEVTSNIDIESEEAILSVIEAIGKEKIVIFISHRLANIINAKQILMLKNGKITEQGTHHELMEHKGDYAEIFNQQKELESYRMGGYSDEKTK